MQPRRQNRSILKRGLFPLPGPHRAADNDFAMLKRAFTYLLLIHLTGALTLFALSERTHADGAVPRTGQTGSPDQNTVAATDAAPLLDLLGNLLSGTVPRGSEQPGDHLSDFFRIRKYTYRFLLWDAWRPEDAAAISAATFSFARQKDLIPFRGLLTLPDYYRFLFRLTPF